MTATLEADNKTPTFTQGNTLKKETTYTLAIAAGVLKNSSDASKTNAATNLSFTTIDKTALTAAWSNASPTFDYGSSATVPTFTVTGGSLGTDYTVAYTKTDESGIITLAAENAGIEAISTSTNTTATVTATVTVKNTADYKMSTTSYDCIITVANPPVATPTLTTGGYFTTDSKSVEITCATDGATIYYSTDNGTSWNQYTTALTITETTTVQAYATKSSYTDSDVASDTYTKIVLDSQTDVTGAVTWNWADVTNGATIDFGDPGVGILRNVDVLFSNISKYGETAVTGLAAQSSLLMNGQRPYADANGSKHCQVNYLKFNTTVPGTVTVEYANTGNNDPRTIKVNNTKGSKSSSANNSYQSETVAVAAGMVTIAGVQVSDDAAKMLRIRKIIFTPTEAISTVSGQTFGTYVTAHDLDFSSVSSSISAYKITGVENGVIQTEALTQVPSGAPILIETASAGATVNVPFAASTPGAITENKLKVGADGIVSDGDNYRYVLAAQGGVTGFYKLTSATDVPANRAYLELTELEAAAAPSMIRIIDEENSATNVENIESEDKAVKFIENGRILIKKNGIVYDALGRVIR